MSLNGNSNCRYSDKSLSEEERASIINWSKTKAGQQAQPQTRTYGIQGFNRGPNGTVPKSVAPGHDGGHPDNVDVPMAPDSKRKDTVGGITKNLAPILTPADHHDPNTQILLQIAALLQSIKNGNGGQTNMQRPTEQAGTVGATLQTRQNTTTNGRGQG